MVSFGKIINIGLGGCIALVSSKIIYEYICNKKREKSNDKVICDTEDSNNSVSKEEIKESIKSSSQLIAKLEPMLINGRLNSFDSLTISPLDGGFSFFTNYQVTGPTGTIPTNTKIQIDSDIVINSGIGANPQNVRPMISGVGKAMFKFLKDGKEVTFLIKTKDTSYGTTYYNDLLSFVVLNSQED